MANSDAAPDAQEIHFTAWHIFLVELLRYFTDLRRIEVRDFVKLGSLPLEADVILLHKKLGEQAHPLQRLMQDELDFLEPRLLDLTVLEFKSPKDVLSRKGIDRACVYALMAKDKFGIDRNRQVSTMLLYSHVQEGLFEELKEDGLVFEEEEEGIRCCRGSLMLYAVNLVTLSKRRPQSPLNLVSAQHEKYSQDPGLDPATLALVERIQYLIRQGKVRGMAFDKLQGFEELSRDADEIRRRFLQGIDPRQRLEGLGPKERLEGLGPKERLEGLGPKQEEELLTLLLAKGLDPKQEEKLLAMLLARREQRGR